MARKDDLWNHRAGGYIEPNSVNGFDILVKGDNKYINFKSLVGDTGYGFRDNNGVIEYKNASGTWLAISASVGGGDFMADGSVAMTGDLDLNENDITDAKSVKFLNDSSPELIVEGQLRWNLTDDCLEFASANAVTTLQIGQEQYVRVFNNSGSIITNGSVVYLDSAVSGRPTIELANNKSSEMARKTIGVLTDDIPDQAEGFVTTFGKVRDIDTSAYTLGDILYVSETNGQLTSTLPTGSRWIVNAGIVTKVGGLDGEIFIRSIQYEKPNELNNITGVPNQSDPDFIMLFGDSTRTFAILPKVSEFNFYQLGVQYRKLSAEELIISDVEGTHYIYYDLGVLSEIVNPTAGQTDDLIRTKVTLAQIYWDATNNQGIILGNENHGCSMSSDTHAYLHFTQGSKWISGMALNTINATGNGSLDSHAQFGIDSGVGTDEDLVRMPSSIGSTNGLPIFYLSGASANLRRVAKLGFSIVMDTDVGVGVTGRLVYNRLNAGTWDLATVPSDDFVLCHIFNTNDDGQPYIAFIGQATYTTLALARTGANSEIGAIITAYPKAEFIPVATVIFQTNTSYTNSVNARVVEVSTGVPYVDWRTSDIQASTVATPTDHNSLSGKQGGTAGEYYHLTNTEYTALATKIIGVGVAKITVSNTQPATPAVGDLWVDTN